jgi:peptide/nickel transport system permease protein
MNHSVNYLLRRLGFYFVAAWAALTLNFFIPRLMPGDPAAIIFARFRGKLKPEAMNPCWGNIGLTLKVFYRETWEFQLHISPSQ